MYGEGYDQQFFRKYFIFIFHQVLLISNNLSSKKLHLTGGASLPSEPWRNHKTEHHSLNNHTNQSLVKSNISLLFFFQILPETDIVS